MLAVDTPIGTGLGYVPAWHGTPWSHGPSCLTKPSLCTTRTGTPSTCVGRLVAGMRRSTNSSRPNVFPSASRPTPTPCVPRLSMSALALRPWIAITTCSAGLRFGAVKGACAIAPGAHSDRAAGTIPLARILDMRVTFMAFVRMDG
jgi:hypothetical protein